jgi:hypothetical protein
MAHVRQRENLLAAQSFTRLYESFPDDTSADDAALEAARSYKRLWRKPVLDATYGETALATYNTLLGLFPTSELADAAREELRDRSLLLPQKGVRLRRHLSENRHRALAARPACPRRDDPAG